VTELAGRNVLVVGLGRSGRAAVRLAKAKGAFVGVSDGAPEPALAGTLNELGNAISRVETGGHTEAMFDWADVIVVSPGVPLALPIFTYAREHGKEIIGEVELAYRYLKCPLIGITGSNGKSTTTALVGAMLRAAGMNVFVGGNFGVPLIEAAEGKQKYDVAVAELSSFQLESIRRLRVGIGVLLNAAPNHQDRYRDFDDYVNAKMRLFSTQLPSDVAVFNAADPQTMAQINKVRARLHTFGMPHADAWLDGDTLLLSVRGLDEIDVSEFALPGAHNRMNLQAAALIARLAGADAEAIGLAASTFTGLKHRLELLGEHDGIRFVNDSKATTLDSVVTALNAVEGPVILLLGGRDKGADWRNLQQHLSGKTKAVVAYGEAASTIADSLTSPAVRVIEGFTAALDEAARLARPGDVVLLSPGCASFDQFTNFEARGDAMREWVQTR